MGFVGFMRFVSFSWSGGFMALRKIAEGLRL